jgi:hypothetical protein
MDSGGKERGRPNGRGRMGAWARGWPGGVAWRGPAEGSGWRGDLGKDGWLHSASGGVVHLAVLAAAARHRVERQRSSHVPVGWGSGGQGEVRRGAALGESRA